MQLQASSSPVPRKCQKASNTNLLTSDGDVTSVAPNKRTALLSKVKCGPDGPLGSYMQTLPHLSSHFSTTSAFLCPQGGHHTCGEV